MTRIHVGSLLLLTLLCHPVLGQQRQGSSRPVPQFEWGQELNGVRAALHGLPTVLYYGEPVEVTLVLEQKKERIFRRSLYYPDSDFIVEFLNEEGEPVQHETFPLAYSSTIGRPSVSVVKLERRSPAAISQHFPIGKYSLRVVAAERTAGKDRAVQTKISRFEIRALPGGGISGVTDTEFTLWKSRLAEYAPYWDPYHRETLRQVARTRGDLRAQLLTVFGEDEWASLEPHIANIAPIDAEEEKLSARDLAKRLTDPDWRTRVQATRTLLRTKDKALLHLVVGALSDSYACLPYTTRPVRCCRSSVFPVSDSAYAALRFLGQDVRQQLLETTDKLVWQSKSRTMKLLRRIPNDDVLLRVEAILKSSSDHGMRLGCIEVLEVSGSAASLILIRLAEMSEAPPKVTEDQWVVQKRNAIEAMGKTKDVRCGPTLVKILSDTSADFQLQREAARSVGLLKYEAAIPYLETLVNHRNRNIRMNAKLALSQIRASD